MKRKTFLLILAGMLALTGCATTNEISPTTETATDMPVETSVLTSNTYEEITNVPTTATAENPPVETPDVQTTSEEAAAVTAPGNSYTDLNVPSYLNETFSSNTGKIVFFLDASVEIPMFSSANVREVVLEELSLDTGKTLADLLIGAGKWDESKQVLDKEKGQLLFEGQGAEYYYWQSKERNEYGNPVETVMQSFRWWDGKLDGGSVQYSTTQENCFIADYAIVLSESYGGEAQGCRYSSEEALGMAAEVASRIAPHLSEIQWCVMGGADNNSDDSAGSRGEIASQAYAFICTANVDDIPVTYTNLENTMLVDSNGRLTQYSSVPPNESLIIVVTDQGISSLKWQSPSRICDPLESNVNLLPFEKIMEVARTILPLKYAWQETSYDRIEYTIDRVTFGYCRVRMKNDISRYILVPAWDFFGVARYYENGNLVQASLQNFQSLLTINAMDGTVIDREEAY